MLAREQYIKLMRDLTSRDPNRVRDANRKLYTATVLGDLHEHPPVQYTGPNREADLALAEIANS